MKATKKETLKAIEELRTVLKPGDTVVVIQRHVSRSGMVRMLDLYTSDVSSRLTWLVAAALEWTLSDKYNALRVDGCGMDMHFHTVHNLGYVLFNDGYALKVRSL